MKRNLLLVIAGSCLIMLSGCAANKKVHERGWVGGENLEANPSFLQTARANYFTADGAVVPALPAEIRSQQASAVLVSRVFADTPLQHAGIQPGDLILAINDQPVSDPQYLHEQVDQSPPGVTIVLAVYRAGAIQRIPVVVGRETYQKWGYLSFGFRLGTKLNLFPYPDFNLFSLVSFRHNDKRLELQSPEYRYYRQALALPPETSERTPNSAADTEGWDAWFLIFGVSGKNIILDQES